VFGALADLELRQGHLHDSAAYWRKALLAIQQRENWGHLPLPLTGWVYVRAAELFYEWNQLDEAAGYVSQGLQRAELGGDGRAILAGYLLSGRLRLSAGDVAAAEGYLERARPLVESLQSAPWRARFERLQLELWLAQKSMAAVAAWCADMLAHGPPQVNKDGDRMPLVLARALLTLGDAQSLEKSTAILHALQQAAQAEGRMSIKIEGLALGALASWKQGEEPKAMVALERALFLAEAQGYVRLFVDLGPPMGRLLQEARTRDVLPAYVAKLLAAMGEDAAQQDRAPEMLPEPLTGRELEILSLLAAGLTNREIGAQLTISPLTVKTHAANIYGKLGVRGRVEATAKARELDLLD
jgi:LuxR family maltose regulon positive regulatory protein